MTISDWLAVAALLLGTISFGYSFLTDRRSRKSETVVDELNSRLLERERSDAAERTRARMTADLSEVEQGKWILEILNRGGATARNVSFRFTGTPPGWRQFGSPFPLAFLNPGDSGKNTFFVVHRDLRQAEIEVTWEDDSGHPGVYRKILMIN